MRIKNWDLLIQILRGIKADPASWDQLHYAIGRPECGTAFCIAGHAIIASGYTFPIEDSGLLDGHAVLIPAGSPLQDIATYDIDYTQDVAQPFDVGQHVLGIEDIDDANLLFFAWNTFAEILYLAEVWAREDGVDWPADLTLSPEHRAAVEVCVEVSRDVRVLRAIDAELLLPDPLAPVREAAKELLELDDTAVAALLNPEKDDNASR
jgi:hypothetical protein